jgi:hypothetical protein
MLLIPKVIQDALIRAEAIIEEYREDHLFYVIKYNSFKQDEYIVHIDVLIKDSKLLIDEMLPQDYDERIEFIHELSSKLEALKSMFLPKDDPLTHINLTKVIYHKIDEYGSEQIVDTRFNDEIQFFIRYQFRLLEQIVSHLSSLKSKIIRAQTIAVGGTNKFKWNGKAAQFGFIIHELIEEWRRNKSIRIREACIKFI